MFRFLAKFWRETLILLLITGLSLTVAYYRGEMADANTRILNAETNHAIASANATLFEEELDRLIGELQDLQDSNNDLEDRIDRSLIEIEKLEARPPETVIRTVYEKVLPEQCLGKFDWMLDEALRMKETK